MLSIAYYIIVSKDSDFYEKSIFLWAFAEGNIN